MYLKILIIIVLSLILAGCASNTAIESTEESQIATMVAATLTSMPAATQIPETEVVQPTATNMPPTSTPTSISTTTAKPTPTLTLTPTQVDEDPKNFLGDATWKASFEDDSNWYTFETDQASIQVEDGALVMKAFTAENYESWSLSWQVLTDFYLEITGTTGDACRGKDRYGIIARVPDPNQGYLFGISCDGSYRVRKWDGEVFSELLGWQQNEHINAGPHQTNRLGFMAEGSKLSFYVNGHLLTVLTDETYPNGTFGIYIGASETPGLTALVSQIDYWELP